MKVIFITSGKIEYVLPGKDLYESIGIVASGKDYPSLSNNAAGDVEEFAKQFMGKKTIVFTAPSNQAMETAEILGRVLRAKVVVNNDLLPLKFRLNEIISKMEFETLGNEAFNVLRERYLDAFYEDKLVERNQQIKTRFKSFVELIEKYEDYQIIMVSHAYLIKLFSIYGLIGEKMFKDREKLFKLFNPSKEPLGRLTIVEIDL